MTEYNTTINVYLDSVMVAVKQLAASEGTEYWVDAVVHYVMSTDWRQRVSLQRYQASSTDYVK